MKRSTLDEFAGSADDVADRSDAATTGSTAGAGPPTDDESAADDELQPAVEPEVTADSQASDDSRPDEREPVTTFAAGSAQPCADCGDSAARRWRTDRGDVCPSCVEW